MKPNKIIPFITFCGQAKEAINYYLNIFPHSKLNSILFFEEGDRGVLGDVLNADFELCGTHFIAMDIEREYCPTPSWQTSYFLMVDTENEFDQLFKALSENGNVLMGPEPVTTSSTTIRKCAWVTDKYQITWQLVFQ